MTTTQETLKKVSGYGSLEARDNIVPVGFQDQVTFFHSDYEVIKPWNNKMKASLIKKVEKFSSLKGLSFHMVTRYKTYDVIEGVAHGIGDHLSEKDLMKNTTKNVTWLKETFNSKVIMVENNNDLGTSAYSVVTNPDFISRVVVENDILLYDHAHALISALIIKYHSQIISTNPFGKN